MGTLNDRRGIGQVFDKAQTLIAGSRGKLYPEPTPTPTSEAGTTSATAATSIAPAAGALEKVSEEELRKKRSTFAKRSTVLAQLGGNDTLG